MTPALAPGATRNNSGRDSGTVRLATGEAVEFEVRIARVGSRVLALLVDILVEFVLAIVLVVVTLMIFAVTGAHDTTLIGAMETIIVVTVIIGYPALIETLTRGRSVGKLAMGLRTVRDDGGPVRFRHVLTRTLVGAALEWPGILFPPATWVASLWTMLANPRSKRLGDLAAGTIVIHERTPASWGWVPAMPPALASWALALDLTGLDDELALSVRHFLARNRQIREPARTALGVALASEVSARTTPPAPPGTPGWAYLAAVLAERNRRASLRLAAARAATVTLWPELAKALRPSFMRPQMPIPAPLPGQVRAAIPGQADGRPAVSEPAIGWRQGI